jgi:hypothetical protein
MNSQAIGIRYRVPAWLRRIGLAGFCFFFLKGMLWLSLPLLARLVLN